jgi:glycine/D-amino acid oxidase-like deaminating enzyme
MTSSYKNLSFWHDSMPGSLDPRPSLESDREADLAIVGAGYTGLWTAYHLKKQQPDLDIVVLEAEIAGYGASGRNGGWCSAFLSGIDKWLDRPEYRDGALRLQKLMFDTVRDIGETAAIESIDCHFEQSGALEIAVIPAHLAHMREEIECHRAAGFGDEDYRWLEQDELLSQLRVDRALGGILMSHCAAIHPARLARGLADVVERMGVRLYEQSPVLELGEQQLRTAGGSVRAPIILLATEGYSGSLPGRNGQLIPVHSMMVCTDPLTREQLDTVGFQKRYAFGNGDRVVTYGQLTADQRIAFGCRGTYHFGSRVQTKFDHHDANFDLVRTTLMRFFPDLEGIGFTHAWGCAMGVSRSVQPSVCFDPTSGLGWAGGYFGNGVGASHLAGQTLADLVLGQDTDRVHTPWVNSPDANRRWEPEPLRWLGIKSARTLMHLADKAEYRDSRLTPLITSTLEKVVG